MMRITNSLAGRKIARVGLFAALLGIAVALSQLDALAIKSDSEVKVSAKATKPDAAGKQIITVTMDINDGWYIYANPVKNETLMEVQTLVSIEGITPQKVEIRYPIGKDKDTAESGKYFIYEGKVAIQAAIQRDANEMTPLEVGVRFMCCHKTRLQCLLPATVKFKLP